MNSSTSFAFQFRLVVHGTPQPAGSKKAFAIKSKNSNSGYRAVVVDDAKKSRPWKDSISHEARKAMAGREMTRGPLYATVFFFVKRPKSHFNSKGEVRQSAPIYPAIRPDSTKLMRAAEDAMTGIVYADDAQLVAQDIRKVYGEPERFEINIVELLR